MKLAAYVILGLAVLAPPETLKTDELETELKAFYVRQAAAYEFRPDTKPDERFKLERKPVLTWTNVEKYMGSVFVWTRGGRPEVIGCIGSHQLRAGVSNFFHEFHSLSREPLAPITLAEKEWAPKKPGLVLAALEEAPVPSATESLRLTQMRNLAREFQATMQDGQDVTELRLLPQPIFRYKAETAGVLDGAIFSFVWKGSDPEVLLVLEARREETGVRWEYGLARFNFRDLWVKRKDKELWRVGVSARQDNYVTDVVGETSHAEIRAAPALDTPSR